MGVDLGLGVYYSTSTWWAGLSYGHLTNPTLEWSDRASIRCQGDALVLESNFKDYELREITALTETQGTDVLSIFLDGDDATLHRRFNKRLNENRHPVHKSQDFTRLEDFTATLDELRRAEYPGELITVDCTDFAYQTDEGLYARIKDFLNN